MIGRNSQGATGRSMPAQLFLDFGTAYCKAATCKRGEPPVPLAIGEAVRRDGRGDPHMIRTALFISQSGRVYFGEAAVDKAASEGRPPYDAIKDALTNANHRRELDDTLLTPQPSVQHFTKRHAITLFLAFFTQAALRACGGPRTVRRSVAMPVFGKDKHQWASEELTKGLAHAHVLALHFGDDLFNSIDLRDAIRVLGQGQDDETQVVADPPTVAEPIAAVAGHLLHFTPDGSNPPGLLMVVDVGAGTTDIAMFAKGQVEGKVTMRHVEGSKVSMPWAGKAIDRALVEHLVRKGNGGDRLRTDLQRERNGEPIKEDMFTERRVTRYGISSSLSDFLSCEAMLEVMAEIKSGFDSVLLGVDRSFFQRIIGVRFSGGGHDLPFLTDLAKPDRYLQPDPRRKGTRVQMRRANQQPLWQREPGYSELYRRVGHKFHRMAVALGGARYCADSRAWLRLQEDISWLGSKQGPTQSTSE